MKTWKWWWAVGVVLLASVANAEIYTWTDSYGTINFTDNKDKVPAKYPLTIFEFTKEKKMTIDVSDTRAVNTVRLFYLRQFNQVEKKVSPQSNVTINIFEKKRKRHNARY